MAENNGKRAKRYKEFELKCRLIEEVMPYPILYDKSHGDHFKPDKKLEIEERIGAILGKDGEYLFTFCTKALNIYIVCNISNFLCINDK